MPRHPETPDPKTTTSKRATPVPSPETEALRATRKLRQLRERYESVVKSRNDDIKKLQDEANAVRAGLSAEARAIVAKLEATSAEGPVSE